MASLKSLIAAAAQDSKEAREAVSMDEQIRDTTLAVLRELGGLTVTDDSIRFVGDKIVLPEAYEGRVPDAIRFLERYMEDQEETYNNSHIFKYRPHDGAHAFQAAMLKHFGTAGMGKATYSFFFGKNPPQMVSVPTGVHTSTQVPWGQVSFPVLDATFTLSYATDSELGPLFYLSVVAPKKYRREIAAFFTLVEEELKINSIYKGKAITGATEPRFLDLAGVDPKKVVYANEVEVQLNANLWSLLKYPDSMRAAGLPLKRSVLVTGTYGTGKTLAGYLTAQEAVANGWTFILCRPGVDDLFDVLKTAELYTPAVVWFEDIDVLAKGGTDEEISELLDALDGMQSKGVEVVAGFTTNHVEQIQRGVLRPGRIDAIVHIGELDAEGYEKLVNNLIPKQHLGEIDYDQLVEAFHGYVPAFVTEAITGAMRYMIARTGGVLDVIATEDIVHAADALRPQFEKMQTAKEGADTTTLDAGLRKMLIDVVNHTKLDQNQDGIAVLEHDEDLATS